MKENHFWNIFTKNRNLKLEGSRDQTLFNIVMPDDKKNYLPFKFGGYTLFSNDNYYDRRYFDGYGFQKWFNISLSLSLPDNPKTENGIVLNLYNPLFLYLFINFQENGKTELDYQ